MASISQLVSEIAHSVGDPNNYALKRNIRNVIIHTRNEIIRHSYENHNYVDRILTQRFSVELKDILDGEIEIPEELEPKGIARIKRTVQKVPRPVRLTNNLPFDRVSTVGYRTNKEFPFIKETSARFRAAVPGLKGLACYDYINGYIYLFPSECKPLDIKKICIESAFEHPTLIEEINNDVDEFDQMVDDNEWLLSEDMIGQIKDIIYKRDLLSQHRETGEITNPIKF
ncbi:MAG: hypothetical protein MJ209_00155 [archaeon]|nr:hypothetical protein [archaeon]